MSKIIVYSTPSCPYCNLVKDYLKQKSIEFEEKDVSLDRAAAREMIEKSGEMGVPQIDIDGTIITEML
jgi:glutaredoxin 3